MVHSHTDEESEHTHHKTCDINNLEAVPEEPALAIDEEKPTKAHECLDIFFILLTAATFWQLIPLELLHNTLELVIEGQNEAKFFDELIDFKLEFSVFQMYLPDDLLQIKDKLIEVVKGF